MKTRFKSRAQKKDGFYVFETIFRDTSRRIFENRKLVYAQFINETIAFRLITSELTSDFASVKLMGHCQ